MNKAFTVFETGTLDDWRKHRPGSFPVQGKRFLDADLELDFFGVNINHILPGEQATSWHSHNRLEELYLFLGGRGEMALDGDVIPVREGTAVRVGQGVMRTWRCRPDSGGPLIWICVRAGGGRLSEITPDHVLDRDRPRPWKDGSGSAESGLVDAGPGGIR